MIKMNRRQFLASSVATAATLLSSRIAMSLDASDQRVKPDKWVNLETMLQKEHPHLNGMTRIDGYKIRSRKPVSIKAPDQPPPWSLTLDKPRQINVPTPEVKRDVMLFGRVEPGEPELRFDDLIVAINSCQGLHGRKDPAISLDPDAKLADALDREMSDGEHDNYRTFEAICKEYGSHVRIDAMPQDCQAAKTLLDADYRMKLIGRGKVKLPIKNFKSVDQILIEGVKAGEDMKEGITNSRYWFTLADAAYSFSDRDSSGSYIESCPIVFNNETTGNANQSALSAVNRIYIHQWNSRMQEILQSELIWKQMNSVYRHFALAKVLLLKDTSIPLLTSLKYAASRVQKINIPSQYPPIPIHKLVSIKVKGGTINWTNVNCGGISLAGRVVKRSLDKKSQDELQFIFDRVLASVGDSNESHGNVVWQ